MNRVRFLGVCVVWFCAVTAVMLVGETTGATKPNIILIMSDDAGYNEFGFTGQLTGTPTQAVTPNLDALAQQGVVLRQGYVTASLCSTSRAGLLLGQYHQRFGFEDNLNNDINSPFGHVAGTKIMPSYLKELGYTTGAIGKWHQGYIDGVNRPLDLGFDEFVGFLGGSRNYVSDANPTNRMMRGNTVIESTWDSAGNGRYVTDFFGEEAVSFINNHAQDADPFFLYVAFTAPHTPFTPFGVKDEDYNHPQIAKIANTIDRTTAAMIYSMDRKIGDMMNALTSHGIDDNTIVVFLNDNGGPYYLDNQVTREGHHNNVPFSGFKGYAFEGGIRVPFLIKAPGLTPGTVYDRPITAFDLLPTFVAAAGGDVAQLETAGVDVTPYLTGETAGDPHEIMFWRGRSIWAVRRGDWKLMRPREPQFAFPALVNIATDPIEWVNRINAEPQIAAELSRELTYWEATLAKSRSGVFGSDDRNSFDHFVFRNDLASNANWGDAGAWLQAGTSNFKTMLVDDAYANAILEFTTKNDGDYTATNNIARMSGLTFMLNQLRLTGNFTGGTNRMGTITGGPLSQTINGNNPGNGQTLLLVKSLSGQLPRLQLDATSSGTSASFTFRVANNLELLDNLEITGNGTQDFVISGQIRDYFGPRDVAKAGTSQVTLTGNNTFRGTLTVNGGRVTLSGASAAINGAADALTQASHKVAEAMYKSGAHAGGQPGAGTTDGAGTDGGGAKTDDVIDAEYVDTDEKKKD